MVDVVLLIITARGVSTEEYEEYLNTHDETTLPLERVARLTALVSVCLIVSPQTISLHHNSQHNEFYAKTTRNLLT